MCKNTSTDKELRQNDDVTSEVNIKVGKCLNCCLYNAIPSEAGNEGKIADLLRHHESSISSSYLEKLRA